MFEKLFIETNPLPIKEALYQKGLIASPICRTLGEMSVDNKQNLIKLLKIFDQPKRCSKMPIDNEEFLNQQTHDLYLLPRKLRSRQAKS